MFDVFVVCTVTLFLPVIKYYEVVLFFISSSKSQGDLVVYEIVYIQENIEVLL